MLDSRITEWQHLISISKLKNLLIWGTPSTCLLEGLRRDFHKIHIACFIENEKDQQLQNLQQHDKKIEILRIEDGSSLPFFPESFAVMIILDGNISRDIYIDTILSHGHKMLSPGGNIIVFTKNGFLTNLKSKFVDEKDTVETKIGGIPEGHIRRKLIQHGYNILDIYAVIPSLEEVRWIVPVQSSKIIVSSLAFCRPTSTIGKMMKKAAILLSKFGFTKLWTPFRIVIAQSKNAKYTNKPTLLSLVKEVLCTNDVKIAFYTGTPGYYQKTTAQVMKLDGKVIAYTKISENPHTGKILENEANILDTLGALSMEHGIVPRVFHFCKENGNTICVQSAVKINSVSNQYKLTKIHIKFLAEIFKKTSKIKKFQESKCFEQLIENIKKLKGRISDEWIDLLRRTTNIIVHDIGDKKIPFGLCHKDFTPWNTSINKGKINIIDWEFAEEESIPFYDILHFEFQKYIVKENAKSSLEAILIKNREYKKSLKDYAFLIDCDTKFLIHYILFYLCDNLEFYLDITEKYWGPEGLKHGAFLKKRKLLREVLRRVDNKAVLLI
jgi:thiamine kinase-like enzyme